MVICLLGWVNAEGAENEYAALMEKYGLQPGLEITRENGHLIKDLVPEAIYKRLLAGEISMTIGKLDPPDKLANLFGPEYYQACKQNAGKYDVGENGGIIDKATGERPWPMPYGLPFPNIDFTENPKKVGAKIEWNAYSLPGGFNEFDIGTAWLYSTHKDGVPDRSLLLRAGRQYIDFRRDFLKPSRPIDWQEVFLFLGPSDAFGTATLTWRWVDPTKWDSVWNYSPSVRRLRRTTSANRSQGTLGTEWTQDDASGYSGKPEMFEWTYIGQQVVLMPLLIPESQGNDNYTAPLPYPTHPTSIPRYQGKPVFEPEYPKVTLPWTETPQRYASWWAPDLLWVPVPVYVVEGSPKDPLYAYGRQIFWYEKATFAPVCKLIYDRSGEYWRTLYTLTKFMNHVFPDGKSMSFYHPLGAMAIDEKTNRGTLGWDGLGEGGTKSFRENYNVGYDPEMLSLSRFLQFGK